MPTPPCRTDPHLPYHLSLNIPAGGLCPRNLRPDRRLAANPPC